MASSGKRLIPTGECWCGCGAETGIGSFFKPGHDKIGESAVVAVEYGSVAALLLAHGFGPDGRNAAEELVAWRLRQRGSDRDG
jgi:Zn-dependent alcohol dehydrogenase